MSDSRASLPHFTHWPSFPFEGHIRVKSLDRPVDIEPPRKGEDGTECTACEAPDDAYIWVSDRWRVRAMDRPTGLPMVLILESRSHLDLGDLPNMLAAELGVMTVRLERAVRSLDGVARVHVNWSGEGEAHLHVWFLARPFGRLQLRGPFLPLWDEILPPVSEPVWRENLALIAAWLAEFGGTPLAEPPRIDWKAPSKLDAATTTGLDSPELAPVRGLDPSTTHGPGAPANPPDSALDGPDAGAPAAVPPAGGHAPGAATPVRGGPGGGSPSPRTPSPSPSPGPSPRTLSPTPGPGAAAPAGGGLTGGGAAGEANAGGGTATAVPAQPAAR